MNKQGMDLKLTVLITAGPTRESIDPVRYISNYSSGKMGYAVASAFLERNHYVVLVSGPVHLTLNHPNLTLIPVVTADEMYKACKPWFPSVHIAIFAAAVADYKPAQTFQLKLKKSADEFEFKFVKTVDIAYQFGLVKKNNQLAVGFALETHEEETHAQEKLHKKNFDLIVLNSMNDKGAAFGFDTNKITLIDRNLVMRVMPLKSKEEVGRDIFEAALSYLPNQNNA